MENRCTGRAGRAHLRFRGSRDPQRRHQQRAGSSRMRRAPSASTQGAGASVPPWSSKTQIFASEIFPRVQGSWILDRRDRPIVLFADPGLPGRAGGRPHAQRFGLSKRPCADGPTEICESTMFRPQVEAHTRFDRREETRPDDPNRPNQSTHTQPPD